MNVVMMSFVDTLRCECKKSRGQEALRDPFVVYTMLCYAAGREGIFFPVERRISVTCYVIG
jgi:hypothetical protein